MHFIAIFLSAFLLTACIGNPSRQVEIARHDLGDPDGRWPATGVAISRVDVRAPAWLDSTVQWYRLGYVDPLTRHSYAENRWVAPPGELLERWLQRHIRTGPGEAAGPGCRLVLWLDELDQRFDSPHASQVVLEARAILQPLRGDRVLARQEFRLTEVVPSPDARGGIQATRAATAALSRDLAQWLAELGRDRPQSIALCNESKEK